MSGFPSRLDVALLGIVCILIVTVGLRYFYRAPPTVAPSDDQGVKQLISKLREDLLSLQTAEEERLRKDHNLKPLLQFTGADVEVSFVVKRGATGTINAVPIEVGANYAREEVQKLTVKLLAAKQEEVFLTPPEPEASQTSVAVPLPRRKGQ